jgi:hypothetical protein
MAHSIPEISYFAEHVAPLRRWDCYKVPLEARRSCVALAYKIGPRRAAYVFAVHPRTVRDWMRTIRL